MLYAQMVYRRLTPKEYERLQGFPDYWTLPARYTVDSEDTDTLRYTAIGNAVSVPVVEWIAQRVHTELLTNRPFLSRDDLQSYVPEFSKTAWSPLHLSEIDFSDESSSYKWPKAGLAWDDSFIGSAVSPTPAKPIPSSLLDIVERERVGERYYLTSNAARGNHPPR